MRDGWQQIALGELLAEKDGLAYGIVQPGHHSAEGIPIIRVGDIDQGVIDTSSPLKVGPAVDETHRRTRLRGGEVLLTIVGTVGRVAIVPPSLKDWNVARAVAVIRTRDNQTAIWLKHALGSPLLLKSMRIAQTDTVQATLNLRDVRLLEIPIPPLPELLRISNLLELLEDLIHLNEEIVVSLRTQMRTLFEQLMLSSGQNVMPLFEVFNIDFGGAFGGEHFTKPGVGLPLIRIRDLKTFEPATWTTERIDGDVLVVQGELLIGMDAEFRPTYWLGEPSLMNQRVCRVRPKIGSLAFAMESLIKPMAFIEGHKTGTTVSHLNKADLELTKISVPSEDALKRFDAVAEKLRLAVIALASENKVLRKTRDELLPLLISGSITVKEVAS